MSNELNIDTFIEATGYAPDILALALLKVQDDSSSGREKCDNCDEWTVDGLTTVDYDEWCESCRDREAHFCEHCEEFSQDSTITVRVSRHYVHSTEEWCESCADNYAEFCEGCSQAQSQRASTLRYTDWGNSYCETCWDDRFAYCEECDEYHDSEDDQCTAAAIHSYGSIPPQGWTPIGTGSKFGVEIEVENADSRTDVATNAHDTYELLADLDGGIWITHDGSLHNGYEITSQPLSLEVWHSNRSLLINAFTELTSRGVRAWDRNTDLHPVGIHVHIDRESFDSEYHLLRFLHLFRTLRADWTRAAGRDCHYADFDGLRRLKRKAQGTSGSNHSDAVSLRNHTVEVRIFRSTLATDRLLGDIELVAAACEFTRKPRFKSHADRLALKHDWARFLALNYPLAGQVWAGQRFTVTETKTVTTELDI